MSLASHAPGGVLKSISAATSEANNGFGAKCEIAIPVGNNFQVPSEIANDNGQPLVSNGMFFIRPKILPEITDTKQASYADTTIIGRSVPIKTYSHSDNRVISIRLHFLVVEERDILKNYRELWAIESATYPREGTPYRPPPVCKIECGKMLGDKPLCAILQNYNIQFPNNVVWDKNTLVPYYFQVNTSWHVVYSSDGVGSLPNQERILKEGS